MPFPRHQEPYAKISIILNAWHLAQLENLSRDIAEWYGVKVSRSEIVRTLVEMAMAKAVK